MATKEIMGTKLEAKTTTINTGLEMDTKEATLTTETVVEMEMDMDTVMDMAKGLHLLHASNPKGNSPEKKCPGKNL